MNQILNTDLHKNSDSLSQEVVFTNDFPSSSFKKVSSKKVFRVQFILSIISIFICSFFYFYEKISLNQKENFSTALKHNYSISQLYAENSSPSSSLDSPTIIGMIEIPKLSLSYPIFSHLNDELLKISPCKFYGEMPPITSNLCIAGHNYDNNHFFSMIGSLQHEDEIFIYNQSGTKFTYSVFNKYEVVDTDLSPIEENYSAGSELTLITCNNLNQRRIVVKAKLI